MAFTYVRVIRDYTLASGEEPVGSVTFTPEVTMYNGWTVPRVPITALLNADGKIDQLLAATTDSTTTPLGTKTYRVVERIKGAPDREYLVEIPHTAGVVGGVPTVDLATVNVLAVPPVVTFPAPGPQGPAGSGGTGGTSDHGALTGLTDDDHPQYYNQTRGDARYSQLAHVHYSPQTLTAVSGVITPNATLGYGPHRYDASADVQLADPSGGSNGQLVEVQVWAVGATRTLSFAGGLVSSVTIPAGTAWWGHFSFDSVKSKWLMDASGGSTSTGGTISGVTALTETTGIEVAGRVLRLGPTDYTAAIPTGGADSAFLVADKATDASDASVLFRSQGVQKAKIGIPGDNDLHLRTITGTEVSPASIDALICKNTTGLVSVPQGLGVGVVPTEKLHVVESKTAGRATAKVENTAATGSESAALVLSGRSKSWFLATDIGLDGTDNFSISSVTTGSPSAISATPTSVGIGIDAPTTKLDVNGAVRLAGDNGLSVLRFRGRKTTSGAPTTGTYAVGDAVLDSAGAWWLCTVAGTPGTWATPSGSGSGYATVQDEGTALTARSALNFAGAGVTVTDDSANSRTLVTIPSSGSGSLTVQDEGSAVTSRSTVNFVGSGVRVTDDATNTRSLVAIHGTTPVMHRGLCVRGFTTGFFDGTTARTTAITAAQTIKADSIAIVFNFYQVNGTSTSFTAFPISTTELTNYIRFIKSKGYKVLLKPHAEPQDVSWRGLYAPSNITTWFTNYTNQMVTYATIAQAEGVDMFSVGSEYLSLTVPANSTRWRAVVTAIRAVYSGPLTYGANGSSMPADEFTQIDWWDDLDNIGIDLYVPADYVSTDPTAWVRSLAVAAAGGTDVVADIRGVAEKYGKPVVLNEYGWSHIPTDATTAQHAQFIDSLLDNLSTQPWYQGGFVWALDDGDVTGVNSSFLSGNAIATVLADAYEERTEVRPRGGLCPSLTPVSSAENTWVQIATVALPREWLEASVLLHVATQPISWDGQVYLHVRADNVSLASSIMCLATAGTGPDSIGYTVASGVVTLWARTNNFEQRIITPLASNLAPYINLIHLGATNSGAPAGLTLATSRATVGDVVTLTDGATVATDASKGNYFRLTAAGNRTLSTPTKATDGQTCTWEHIASAGARTLALATGTAGSFKFGTTVTALTATTSGLRDLITATYSASLDRWMVRTVEKGF